MTIKEAIDYLKDTGGYTFADIDNPKHNEAINLAIKALEFVDYYHPIWGVSYLHQDSITQM